jgi:hypothetical protein
MSIKANHFKIINRRILWLTDKIAWCAVNEQPSSLYISERESLIWLCDKVNELASTLHRVTSRDTITTNLTPEQELITVRARLEQVLRDKNSLTEALRLERSSKRKKRNNKHV